MASGEVAAGEVAAGEVAAGEVAAGATGNTAVSGVSDGLLQPEAIHARTQTVQQSKRVFMSWLPFGMLPS